MQQYGTLRQIWPVRPLPVNELLNKYQGCVWYKGDISLAYHGLVGTFQLGTTRRKKLNIPTRSIIISGMNCENKEERRESTLQILKKCRHWGGNSISFCIVWFE